MTNVSRFLLGALLLGLPSCQSEPESACAAGSEGCACSEGQCFVGLQCLSGTCVQSGVATSSGETDETSMPPMTGDDATADDTATDGPGMTGDTTSSGGCQGSDGTIDCPCLGDGGCQGDLECDSNQVCVCLSGTPCGDSDCVADFQTDDRHCGTCGNACQGFGASIGYCTAGVCPPTLSDCVPSDQATTCDAICQAQGRECATMSCGDEGFSWIDYANDVACERNAIESFGFDGCADDLGVLVEQDFVRCCCTP